MLSLVFSAKEEEGGNWLSTSWVPPPPGYWLWHSLQAAGRMVVTVERRRVGHGCQVLCREVSGWGKEVTTVIRWQAADDVVERAGKAGQGRGSCGVVSGMHRLVGGVEWRGVSGCLDSK